MLKGYPRSATSTKKKDVQTRLAAEYRNPSPPQSDVSLVMSPLIVFEKSEPLNRIHLTVVWDDPDWKSLDLASRCEITMRAFAEVYPEQAAQVSSSLGTTTEEADSFDVNVEEILRSCPDLKPEDLRK